LCNDIISGADYSRTFNDRISTWPPNTRPEGTTGKTFSFYNSSPAIAPRPEEITDPLESIVVAPLVAPQLPTYSPKINKMPSSSKPIPPSSTIIFGIDDIYVYGVLLVILILILLLVILML
jgi:hypothetical protein